jgi:hypothetical protein
MAKTVNMVNPQNGATIIGTITEDEYAVYLAEGFEDVEPA